MLANNPSSVLRIGDVTRFSVVKVLLRKLLSGDKGSKEKQRIYVEGLVTKIDISLDSPTFYTFCEFIRACKAPVMVIVTELLIGEILRKCLVNMRPRGLDTQVAIGFALDIARVMECLHSHGIIHRDLKPGSSLCPPEFGRCITFISPFMERKKKVFSHPSSSSTATTWSSTKPIIGRLSSLFSLSSSFSSGGAEDLSSLRGGEELSNSFSYSGDEMWDWNGED
ncbi:hypothetical protein L6452_20141 [Arctium lappa]|uniref:Uncharacterized protein n=1 Tax=Arctium lappa TaxID=4217 RepID=A0ACB9BBW1_ARCLA|nr:hypothetical protein L6452_20141 [Arctium lappa]